MLLNEVRYKAVKMSALSWFVAKLSVSVSV